MCICEKEAEAARELWDEVLPVLSNTCQDILLPKDRASLCERPRDRAA